MTKEEVAEVVAYCDENKISYKQRLSELGISDWSFYSAKRKYAPKQDGDNAGDCKKQIYFPQFRKKEFPHLSEV